MRRVNETWLAGITRRILTNRQLRQGYGTLAKHGTRVTITQRIRLVPLSVLGLKAVDGPPRVHLPTDLNSHDSQAALAELNREAKASQTPPTDR